MNGAQSSRGTTEAETNLKIALKLQNLLEQSGSSVVLTRSDENAIYDLDAKTLKEKKIFSGKNMIKILCLSYILLFLENTNLMNGTVNKYTENQIPSWVDLKTTYPR